MKRSLFALFLSAALSGCILSSPPPRNSRFVVDISQMQKSDFMYDTWIFRHPTLRVRDYNNFDLVTMLAFPQPVKKLSVENRARYDVLASKCEGYLRGMIEKGPNAPAAGGSKVLDFKVAIIDIKPLVHFKRNGNDIYSTNPDLKGSKFEIDCHDHKTGELVFAISTLLKGEDFARYEDPGLAPVLEKEFISWIQFLSEKLSESKQN